MAKMPGHGCGKKPNQMTKKELEQELEVSRKVVKRSLAKIVLKKVVDNAKEHNGSFNPQFLNWMSKPRSQQTPETGEKSRKDDRIQRSERSSAFGGSIMESVSMDSVVFPGQGATLRLGGIPEEIEVTDKATQVDYMAQSESIRSRLSEKLGSSNLDVLSLTDSLTQLILTIIGEESRKFQGDLDRLASGGDDIPINSAESMDRIASILVNLSICKKLHEIKVLQDLQCQEARAREKGLVNSPNTSKPHDIGSRSLITSHYSAQTLAPGGIGFIPPRDTGHSDAPTPTYYTYYHLITPDWPTSLFAMSGAPGSGKNGAQPQPQTTTATTPAKQPPAPSVVALVPIREVSDSVSDVKVPEQQFVQQHVIPVKSGVSTFGRLHVHTQPAESHIHTLAEQPPTKSIAQLEGAARLAAGYPEQGVAPPQQTYTYHQNPRASQQQAPATGSTTTPAPPGPVPCPCKHKKEQQQHDNTQETQGQGHPNPGRKSTQAPHSHPHGHGHGHAREHEHEHARNHQMHERTPEYVIDNPQHAHHRPMTIGELPNDVRQSVVQQLTEIRQEVEDLRQELIHTGRVLNQGENPPPPPPPENSEQEEEH